jgi:hypothetical protein
MKNLFASLLLALIAAIMVACGGDTNVTNNFGEFSFERGGDTSISDDDTVTTITTGTSAPGAATATVAPWIDMSQRMSCKYMVELRGYDDPFQQTRVERGGGVYKYAELERVCVTGKKLYLEEVSMIASIGIDGSVPIVNPDLQLDGQPGLVNAQFDEVTRVATWRLGRHELNESVALFLRLSSEVRREAALGYGSLSFRSIVVRDEDGQVVPVNVDSFNTIFSSFEIVETIQEPMCNGWGFCGNNTQWDGAVSRCVSTVTNVPGSTYCGNNTVWNPATGNCIASIPPPPPQPMLPIAVYGLPTNSGNEVHRGDSFTIHQHLVGTIPAGSTVGLQIRLNGVAQSDLNGPVQVYVNDQSQQQGLTPIPFNGNQILYFWYTTQVPSTLLNIRLVVPTAVSMPTGSYTVEVLTAEVTLPNSTFASVNVYGQQSNIVVSN